MKTREPMKIDTGLQKIKDEIEKQKAVVEPIKKQFEAAYSKYDKLQKKLEKYRLEHKMFYPLSQLAEFKDKNLDIESICFVQKTKKGKFKIDWIFNDDLFRINDDGTFYYSSYENGIIQYDKDEKRWCHDFYHSRKRLDDYVGFMKIVFNDENAYNVEPPDLETYKDENIV